MYSGGRNISEHSYEVSFDLQSVILSSIIQAVRVAEDLHFLIVLEHPSYSKKYMTVQTFW
jgi:hypothetical protein